MCSHPEIQLNVYISFLVQPFFIRYCIFCIMYCSLKRSLPIIPHQEKKEMIGMLLLIWGFYTFMFLFLRTGVGILNLACTHTKCDLPL